MHPVALVGAGPGDPGDARPGAHAAGQRPAAGRRAGHHRCALDQGRLAEPDALVQGPGGVGGADRGQGAGLHPLLLRLQLVRQRLAELPQILWLFPPPRALFRQDQGWISKGYGMREPAPVLVYAVNGRTPIQLRTDLVLVARRFLVIGIPSAENASQAEQVTRVALLHVTELRDLPSPAAPPGAPPA